MSGSVIWNEPWELTPRIVVFGVGGAGGNAINNMIAKELDGVEFVAANTDAQALRGNKAPRLIQMGASTTKGLGAGARPDIGGQAAEESHEEIRAALEGANMCFVTAGMGGGTGTGAAPIIAKIAREAGVLTVGVVTKPFAFEGARRMKLAEAGIEELQAVVDTLIVIPNQNLFRVANERTSFADAFVLADDVLYQGVKGVTDLMVRPGLVNLDFADVRAVMDEMGKAMMGSGEADGERRALEAAERAIDNPLLDEVSLKGARGVLINITGGPDMKLFEVDEAANLIRKEADPDAAVFFGSALDPAMEGRIRVSVVATGIDPTMSAWDEEEPEPGARRRPGQSPSRLSPGSRPAPRPSESPARTAAPTPQSAARPQASAAAPARPRPAVEPAAVAPRQAVAAPRRIDQVIELETADDGDEAALELTHSAPEPAASVAVEREAVAVEQPVEAKAAEPKPAEPKAVEPKPAEAKPAEAKPAAVEAVASGDMHRVEIPSFLRRSIG